MYSNNWWKYNVQTDVCYSLHRVFFVFIYIYIYFIAKYLPPASVAIYMLIIKIVGAYDEKCWNAWDLL